MIVYLFPALTIFVASLLWALCYPPFPLGPLAFAVLAPAFLATTILTPGRAFRAWFLAGLAYNTVMYWWIWNVMKVGPAFVVGGGLVVLVAFLSLFNGLLGLGFARAWRLPPGLRRTTLLCGYPLAWAGLEAFRAAGEMSFPWNNLAYTLGHHPVLFQTVSWWGVYGLSTLILDANLLLMLAFLALFPYAKGPSGKHSNSVLSTKAFSIPSLLFVAVPLLLGVTGTRMLHQANDQNAPRLDISMVQPSIPQTKKWDEGYFAEVIAKTFRTMLGHASGMQIESLGGPSPVRGSDLILLPETAVPDFLRTRDDLMDSLQAVATNANAPLVIGSLDYVVDRRPWSEYRFYNAAFLFTPGPQKTMATGGNPHLVQYNKMRLVPFSEKLPFDGVFPVINYVNLGEGDFSAGDGHPIWGQGDLRWAPSICYEVIYPSFAREARLAGARLLVNITNDGWFGRSNGPYQHANIARFRAAENGMPVARAANNGVSVFYDAWGRDLGHTALMDSTVLRRAVPLPNRHTFYTRAGRVLDVLFMGVLAGWVLLALLPSRSLRRQIRMGEATPAGVH